MAQWGSDGRGPSLGVGVLRGLRVLRHQRAAQEAGLRCLIGGGGEDGGHEVPVGRGGNRGRGLEEVGLGPPFAL